uniref:Uncharacterized protein n=1 Tax=Faxonius propinquus nudivirus TaxID=3139431 RepID=A0AAU8GBX7_9VIRU
MESCVKEIKSIDDIIDIFKLINPTENYYNIIPTCEEYLWQDISYKEFKISITNVDRVYYFQRSEINSYDFIILVRVKYNNNHLFIQLITDKRQKINLNSQFFCYDVNIFFNCVFIKVNLDICKLLERDNYNVNIISNKTFKTHFNNEIEKNIVETYNKINEFYDI